LLKYPFDSDYLFPNLKAICTTIFHRHILTWREFSNALQVGGMRFAHQITTLARPLEHPQNFADHYLFICLPPTLPA
jgi:hypothetical protein